MRVSFYTLGCRLNQSETSVLKRTFETDGYRLVDFDQPSDIAVINTCTVTEHGDADTHRLVHKVNRLNPKVRIALIGCQAQMQKEKLAKLPNVRWVVGNARKMDLVSILENDDPQNEPQVITPAIPRENFTLPIAGIDHTHTRANLKIQDGCDFFCSFCEIPYARGRARSRKFEDILCEANALVAAGFKELILTGINLGTYQDQNYVFLDCIKALEQIQGLERIRISSIEPTTISMDIIRRMAQSPKLCRHLHIPVQSGNDQILKAMKRKYTFRQFQNFILRVYEDVPHVCLGTDVIVGFPGETDQHFFETKDRLSQLPMHYFHVFSYSQRYLAQSRKFKNVLPTEVIQSRSQMLRELSQRKRLLFYEKLLGTIQKVLFEQKKEGAWMGLTDNYVRVKVLSDKNLANCICEVKLKDLNGSSICGQFI